MGNHVELCGLEWRSMIREQRFEEIKRWVSTLSPSQREMIAALMIDYSESESG